MSEREHQRAIIEAAQTLGYFVHHDRPSMTRSGQWSTAVEGNIGFPDLVVAGHGKVWFRELKMRGGSVTPYQQRWLDRLVAAGADAAVLWLSDGQDPFIAEMAAQRDVALRHQVI